MAKRLSRMPFGVVSGVSRGIGVLEGGGDRRRESAVFGVNLGHPIVTNRDFETRLFPNYVGQDLLDLQLAKVNRPVAV